MKNFIKTLIALTLLSSIFQSCESDDTPKDTISDEQKITADLAEKIIATSNPINDYDFFVSNVNAISCEFPSTLCYFNNPQGDYYRFVIRADSFDNWLSEYNAAKLEALNTTGAAFTDEDFILEQLNIETGFFGFTSREGFLLYFENCDNDPDLGFPTNFGVPFVAIDTNCNGAEMILTLADEILSITDTKDVTTIQSFLNSINENNNSNYSLEDILVSAIIYEAPNGEEVSLLETENILNYFDGCLLNRSTNDEGCLQFMFPLDVIRFDSEQATISLENNSELFNTFSNDVEELSFIYPISLEGQDGTVIEIATNAGLEEALDNSVDYCN